MPAAPRSISEAVELAKTAGVEATAQALQGSTGIPVVVSRPILRLLVKVGGKGLAMGATAAVLLPCMLIMAMLVSVTDEDEQIPYALADKPGDEIPEEYLRAYQDAGRAHQVPWTVLAAIGRVQSTHGRSAPSDIADYGCLIDRDPDRAKTPQAPPAHLFFDTPTQPTPNTDRAPLARTVTAVSGGGATFTVNTAYAQPFEGLLADLADKSDQLRAQGSWTSRQPLTLRNWGLAIDVTSPAKNGLLSEHTASQLQATATNHGLVWKGPTQNRPHHRFTVEGFSHRGATLIYKGTQVRDRTLNDPRTVAQPEGNSPVQVATGVGGSCWPNKTSVFPTVQPAIGTSARGGKGPFLFLPSAPGLEDIDPQNVEEATDLLGELVAETAAAIQQQDLADPDPFGDGDLSAQFWPLVIDALPLADPSTEIPSCSARPWAETNTAALIASIWSCQAALAPTIEVLSTTNGQLQPLSNSQAQQQLVDEALAVSWGYSKWGRNKCNNRSPHAGVFPLSRAQAEQWQVTNRCDRVQNISAAARIVIAAEKTPLAQRSNALGPFAPALGGWANIQGATGNQTSRQQFAARGAQPRQQPTSQCTELAYTWISSLTAQRTTVLHTRPLAKLSQPTSGTWQSVSKELSASARGDMDQACQSADPHAVRTMLATRSELLAEAMAEGAADYAAQQDPQGPSASLRRKAAEGARAWFNGQAQRSTPKVSYGTQSAIARLSPDGIGIDYDPAPAAAIATGPASRQAALVVAFARYYGGLTINDRRAGQPPSIDLYGGAGHDASAPGVGAASAQADKVIAAALKWLGTDYSWGGGGPAGPSYGIEHGASIFGFDCSGLTEYAYAQVGYAIGGTTKYQQYAGRPVASLAQAQPGDLILFGRPVYHVGIYLGEGRMVHAPRTGDVVKIAPVSSSGRPSVIRRVLPPPAPAKQGVDAWISQALTVLYRSGFPKGPSDAKDLRVIIMHESSGDPDAVNNWDSNATAGHPSFGLMQTIPSTFEAYKLPPHTSRSDPVAQIVAGARYAQQRYGGLHQVPGVVAVRQGKPYVGY